MITLIIDSVPKRKTMHIWKLEKLNEKYIIQSQLLLYTDRINELLCNIVQQPLRLPILMLWLVPA